MTIDQNRTSHYARLTAEVHDADQAKLCGIAAMDAEIAAEQEFDASRRTFASLLLEAVRARELDDAEGQGRR